MSPAPGGPSPAGSDEATESSEPGSLDEIEGRLRAWVARIEPAAAVAIGPADRTAELGVSFQLLGMASHREPRGRLRPPVRLWLRYLVTTWAGDAGRAERLLVNLALDATEQPDLEVDFRARRIDVGPVPPAPSPSFEIRLLITRSRTAPAAKRVLEPLIVRGAQSVRVAGTVLGPGDVPIAGAIVGVVGIDAAATTDGRGHFVIQRVPRTDTPARIRVRAKGVDAVFAVPGSDEEAAEMSVRLDLMGRKNA